MSLLLAFQGSSTPPDPSPDPVRGTMGLRSAAAKFGRAAIAASLFCTLTAPGDASALGTQPDTFASPIPGQSSIVRAGLTYRARVGVVNPLLWSIPEDVSGPLGVQPDTFIQPIASSPLTGPAQLFVARARTSSALLWSLPEDTSTIGPQSDTYVPPIASSPLTVVAKTFSARSIRANTLLWGTAQDTSGPQAPQPDTAIQPIAGTAALRQASTAYTSRVGAAARGWTIAQDQPVAAVVTDPAIQPVAGVSALGQAAQASRARAGAASVLGWTTAQDLSGPLGVQPDTYVQPVAVSPLTAPAKAFTARAAAANTLVWSLPQDLSVIPTPDTFIQPIAGAGALAASGRTFTVRAVQASPLLWSTAQDVSGPLGPQPDTSIQPIAGTLAQGQAIATYRARASAASLGWVPASDLPVAPVSTDTYQPPVQGVAALGRAQQAWRARVATASTLGWSLPEDTSTIGAQPDTAIQPIPGTTALGTKARTFAARVVTTATLGWTAPGDLSTPPPDTWSQPLQGVQALATSMRQYQLRATIARTLVQTPPRDLSGPQGPQPDTYTVPIQGLAANRVAMRASWTRSTTASAFTWSPAGPVPPVTASALGRRTILVVPQGRLIAASQTARGLIVPRRAPVTIAPVPYDTQVAADGASAYWPQGEASGTVALDTIDSHPGTYVGTVTLGQPGALGSSGPTAAAYTGAGYADMGDVYRLTSTPFSIEIWVQTTQAVGGHALIGKIGLGGLLGNPSGWILQLTDGGQGLFDVQNGGNSVFGFGQPLVTPSSIADGQWHHLVATWTGTHGSLGDETLVAFLYLDGVPVASNFASLALLGNSSPLRIAQFSDSTGPGDYVGLAQRAAIYPRVLTPAHVVAHYQAGLQLATLQRADGGVPSTGRVILVPPRVPKGDA